MGCPNDIIHTTYGVTISPSGAASGETVTGDLSEAAEGATVTLTAALNSGRQVTLRAPGISISPATISTDGGTATFTMGENVETSTQEVTLSKKFWMGETEVTQGLWEDVYTTWPGTAPGDTFGIGIDYPAYYVNWYDALAFCNLLTQADDSIADVQQVYYSDAELTTAYTKADVANNDLSM